MLQQALSFSDLQPPAEGRINHCGIICENILTIRYRLPGKPKAKEFMIHMDNGCEIKIGLFGGSFYHAVCVYTQSCGSSSAPGPGQQIGRRWRKPFPDLQSCFDDAKQKAIATLQERTGNTGKKQASILIGKILADDYEAIHGTGSGVDEGEGKPLFLPLMGCYYDAFKSLEKNTEYRRYGSRWNEKTCWRGRAVTLSRGYGKQNRMRGVIDNCRKIPFEDLEEDLQERLRAIGISDCPIAAIRISVFQ